MIFLQNNIVQYKKNDLNSIKNTDGTGYTIETGQTDESATMCNI